MLATNVKYYATIYNGNQYRNQYVYYSDLTGQSLIGRVGFNGSTPESLVVTGIGLEFIGTLS